jgi:hypothetical protein
MFWAFKLSFDTDDLVFWATFFPEIWQKGIQFSGHTDDKCH